MAGAEDNPRLKETKAMIRSVLMSCKEGVAASKFLNDYRGFTGEAIPFQQLGFSSVTDFIKSMPDVAYVKNVQGQLTYFAVANKDTQHIQSLIQRQKSNPKKSKFLRKGGLSRFPKFRSQAGRFFISSEPTRPMPVRSTVNHDSRFTHPYHAPAFMSPEIKMPLPHASFSANDLSPLTVTFHSRIEEGDEKRAVACGGRQMVATAIRDVVKQHDKKASGFNRSYELPPRFQKRMSSTASETANDSAFKPVAGPDETYASVGETSVYATIDDNSANYHVVPPSPQSQKADSSLAGPHLSEEDLPSGSKAWVVNLLKSYPNGLWSTRFTVLFEEEFGQAAPSNLINIVQTWTDAAEVEMNEVAKRYMLYPVKDVSKSEDYIQKPPASVVEKKTPEKEAAKETKQKWKNFIVPIARLFEVREVTTVYASFSVDPYHFYLQREDSCVDEITEKLNEVCKENAIPSASDLQAGVFCAALFKEDNNWYRARVLYLHSDTEVHLMFIDYGNVETVSISDVRCLTQETAEIPAQAVGCAIFALKPFEGKSGWSEEAKTTFHSLMADKKLQAHTIKIAEGLCIVELWSDDNTVSLNEQLYNAKLVDTYLPKNLDPTELQVPDEGYIEVVVAFVDMSHCWLRLIGPEYSDKLEAFEDNLESLYKQTNTHFKKLQEGSICIVHTEHLHHRVKITEIKDSQANCFFVDHGYTELFPLDQLSPLEADINQSLPYQAIQCVLLGLEQYMSNVITITELVERFKNKIFVAEVITRISRPRGGQREPLKVMLYDTHGAEDVNINEEIAKKLQAEGHPVDMSLFSLTADMPLEEGGTSNHGSGTGSTSQLDMEHLQSVTKCLSLNDRKITTTVNDRKVCEEVTVKPSEPMAMASVNSDVSLLQASRGSSPSVSSPPIPTASSSIPAVVCDSVLSIPAVVTDPLTSKPVTVIDSSSSAPWTAPVSKVVSPYNDSLSVAYHTWSLPAYVSLPEIGQFFDVYIQSASDPSNFVIVPLSVVANLEKTMQQMNSLFNAEFASQQTRKPSPIEKAVCVPDPQTGHLYMTQVDGVFYRAVYISSQQSLRHVFLPDYYHHAMIKPDELFFLPKQFWSLPFTAFRASLHGVKAASTSSSKTECAWSESAKYSFIQLTFHKNLVALLMGTQESLEVDGAGDVAQTSRQKLSLQLINTMDPNIDIIVAEQLVELGFAVSYDL